MPEEKFPQFRSLRRAIVLLNMLLVAAGTPVLTEQLSCGTAPAPKGVWVQEGGGVKIRFEEERVVVLRSEGDLRAATILSREPCKLVVRDEGLRSTWRLAGDEQKLRLALGKGTALTLVPLSKVPSSLDINPLPLPPVGPISPEKVKEIASELTAREQRDQEMATTTKPEEKSKRPAALAENVRYLREVVGHYGWIDIPRFGRPAAAAAILIVKHGDDVPLMQAALPIVEKDALENGGGKELVSILVDEVLITTGHKQKYGTQLGQDESGKPYVIPVEDAAKVDGYRKALGILSWSAYLKRASEALYGGVPIRIPGPDE
jgi:hypothetical protein